MLEGNVVAGSNRFPLLLSESPRGEGETREETDPR
jgi:hypothetical protein